MAAALAVVLVAGVAAWMWRHPTTFDDAGGFGQEVELEVGEVLYVEIVIPPSGATGEVQIDSVEPHIVEDTSAAELDFYLCEYSPDRIASGGQAIVEESCGQLVPAEGVTWRLTPEERQQLLLKIAPTKEGTLLVRGADVTYTDGWQHGTQRTGGEVAVDVS